MKVALQIGLALMATSVALAQDQPTLRLSAGPQSDTLVVTAGRPTTVQLSMPGNVGWREAYIGRLVVRTLGRQQSMMSGLDPATGQLSWTFDQPGTAVVLLEAGPPALKNLSDAWQRTTYCTRLIVRVEARGNRKPFTADPGVTAKAGQRIEIMPLVDPTTLRPGEDMSVRVYFGGSKKPDAKLSIAGPNGSTTIRADASGIAHFPVDAAGRWTVRFEHTDEDTPYLAQLIFDVRIQQEARR